MTSMLPIFLIAASSGKKDVAESFMISSNLLPETPRTLLAFNAAEERERVQQRTAEDVAAVLEDRQFKLTQEQLMNHPYLGKLIDRLPQEKREKIVEK